MYTHIHTQYTYIHTQYRVWHEKTNLTCHIAHVEDSYPAFPVTAFLGSTATTACSIVKKTNESVFFTIPKTLAHGVYAYYISSALTQPVGDF
jgi:hypothetical protein